MKHERIKEEYHSCDECHIEIKTVTWYKLFTLDRFDFCSRSCAETFRAHFIKVVVHDTYPREIGNTD